MAVAGLSAGLKTSLYSLQDIGTQIDATNTRLSTGKKVNSALDNALNYFLAAGFQTKANNYSSVLDNINLGINTITQANSALTSITSSLNQALGTLKSALNSAGTQSRATASVGFLDASGNAVTASTASASFVTDSTFSNKYAFQSGDVLTIALQTQNATGYITGVTTTSNVSITLTGGTTVQSLLNSINNAAGFNAGGANSNLVTASISDSGNLVIEANVAGQQVNTSTTEIFALSVGLNTAARTGVGTTGDYSVGVFNFAGGVGNSAVISNVSATNQVAQIVSGTTQNTTRSAAAQAFRAVLTQISQSAGDAGYNGTNLLNGDFLTTYTNDTQSASIVTQGVVYNSTTLGFTTDVKQAGSTYANLQNYIGDAARNFQGDSEIKLAITKINNAINTVSQFTTNLATNNNLLQNRQVFTTATVRNFTNGADSLTLADINQEGANLSSLQTKQQLAVQALSLANRSDQSILRLFG